MDRQLEVYVDDVLDTSNRTFYVVATNECNNKTVFGPMVLCPLCVGNQTDIVNYAPIFNSTLPDWKIEMNSS